MAVKVKDKIKIDKIVISFGDKEIEGDIEELKELKEVLDKLFPEKELHIIREKEYCKPYIWHPLIDYDYPYTITCGTSHWEATCKFTNNTNDTQTMYLSKQ